MNRNKFSLEEGMFIVLPISMIEFTLGIGSGWTAPTIKKLLEDSSSLIRVTAEECSWIVSLYNIGKTIGSLVSMSLLDVLGRSFMLRIGSTIIFLNWLIIMLTSSVTAIMLARLSFGIGLGICDGICSIYLGENCTPKTRGVSSCIGVAVFYTAVLQAYILATYLSYTTVAIVSSAISFVCIICTFLAIESSQFLILHGKYQKAEKNLMRLRGTTDRNHTVEEYEKIKFNVELEKQKKFSIKELISNPSNYKSIIIVLIISIAQPGSGNSAVFVYIAVILSSWQISLENEFVILYGIFQLISAILCSLYIEKFNRRTISWISYAILTFTNIGVAVVYYFKWYSSAWTIFMLISIYGYFSVVTDSIYYIVRGELFPQSIKPFGAGVCNIAQAAIGLATVKVFLTVTAAYGMHINFIIYAVVSFFAFVFCFFFLPETRGKTLVEIQEIIEKKVSKGNTYHRTISK